MVFHPYQSKDTKTTGWPYTKSSISTDISHETFTPDKTITLTSSSFSDSHTTQSEKEPLSTPVAASTLITERASTSPTSISWVTSKVSTIGKQEELTTYHYLTISSQLTTVAFSQTHWTQGTENTGGILVSSTSSNMTQTFKTVMSVSPSSKL